MGADLLSTGADRADAGLDAQRVCERPVTDAAPALEHIVDPMLVGVMVSPNQHVGILGEQGRCLLPPDIDRPVVGHKSEAPIILPVAQQRNHPLPGREV